MRYILPLILIWMRSCYSKEFCEEFRKNGNKIDFVFRRMVVGKKFYNRYGSSATNQTDLRTLHLGWLRYRPVFDLFIDGYYWRVRMGDPLISLSLTFLDRNRKGIETPFFKGYRMGADIPNSNHNHYSRCKTVLFSNSSVKFGNIPNSRGQTDLNLVSYREWLPSGWPHNSLPVPQDPRLDFAFTPIPDLPTINIDFATKSLSNPTISGNPVNYRLSFCRYTLRNGFNQNADRFIPNPIPDDEYSIFKNWTTPYNIIGVTTMPDTWLDLTLMILMADEKRVLFCMTLHNFTSDYCRDPVELVNCSSNSIKTTSTVPPTTTTAKSTVTSPVPSTTTTMKSTVTSPVPSLVTVQTIDISAVPPSVTVQTTGTSAVPPTTTTMKSTVTLSVTVQTIDTSVVPSTTTAQTITTPLARVTTNTLKSIVPSSATNDTKLSSPYSSSTDLKITFSSTETESKTSPLTQNTQSDDFKTDSDSVTIETNTNEMATTSSELIKATMKANNEFTFNIEDIPKYWKQITLALIIFVIIVVIVSAIVFSSNPSVIYIGPADDSQTDN